MNNLIDIGKANFEFRSLGAMRNKSLSAFGMNDKHNEASSVSFSKTTFVLQMP